MKKFANDLFKSILGHAELMMSGMRNAPDELIVLCMHSTPTDRLSDFDELCNKLLCYFKPIDPKNLNDYFAGRLNEGPYLLFTFDDGLKNNLGAAEILKQKGIFAYFFLVPAFLEAADGESYYRRHIRQIIDPNYDHEPEDFTPMNSHDIRGLLAAGHKIGSHTMTHLLRSTSTEEEIYWEVLGSKEWLQNTFSIEVDAFCSPINTSLSVNALAKKLIKENYLFHFTTYPGLNAEYRDQQLICRRNIETDWPFGKISFALGRWDLKRWQAGIAQHRSL